MRCEQGLVKLADFGVASRLGEIADEEDPAAIAVVGTPYWMAPEVRMRGSMRQWKGAEVSSGICQVAGSKQLGISPAAPASKAIASPSCCAS